MSDVFGKECSYLIIYALMRVIEFRHEQSCLSHVAVINDAQSYKVFYFGFSAFPYQRALVQLHKLKGFSVAKSGHLDSKQ